MIPNYDIYVLANSQGPFSDLGVPANENFVPLNLSDDEQAVHEGMFLDFRNNDFYLTGYFASILSMPDLQRYFRSPTSFDLSKTPPTGTSIIGGSLINNFYAMLLATGAQELLLSSSAFATSSAFPNTTASGGSFLNNPNLHSYYTGIDATLPLGFNYNIQFYAPGTCLLSCLEKGTSTYATCQDIGSDPNKILRITWPDGWPFTGLIQLSNQVWMDGAELGIIVRPHNFPFFGILQAVQHLPYAIQATQQLQVDSAYYQSIDSVEKTAYLVAAIIMDRKSKIRQQRNG